MLATEDELVSLIIHHIIPGVAFLRFVGSSSCANDGQRLLRSLILEMRQMLDPGSSLQHGLQSTLSELSAAMVVCLQHATVECSSLSRMGGCKRVCARGCMCVCVCGCMWVYAGVCGWEYVGVCGWVWCMWVSNELTSLMVDHIIPGVVCPSQPKILSLNSASTVCFSSFGDDSL